MTIERWQAEPWMDQTAIIRGMGEHIDRLESELTAVQTRLAEAKRALGNLTMMSSTDAGQVYCASAVDDIAAALSTPTPPPAPEPDADAGKLARANCLLLCAHPIVARSKDHGLRGAIAHHLRDRSCGFYDREPPAPEPDASNYMEPCLATHTPPPAPEPAMVQCATCNGILHKRDSDAHRKECPPPARDAEPTMLERIEAIVNSADTVHNKYYRIVSALRSARGAR